MKEPEKILFLIEKGIIAVLINIGIKLNYKNEYVLSNHGIRFTIAENDLNKLYDKYDLEKIK